MRQVVALIMVTKTRFPYVILIVLHIVSQHARQDVVQHATLFRAIQDPVGQQCVIQHNPHMHTFLLLAREIAPFLLVTYTIQYIYET